MNQQNREALLGVIRDAVGRQGEESTVRLILEAHLGRPDGLIVNEDNQHLFRQYRNSVSSSAVRLISEAFGRVDAEGAAV
jgi:hypothetical protein